MTFKLVIRVSGFNYVFTSSISKEDCFRQAKPVYDNKKYLARNVEGKWETPYMVSLFVDGIYKWGKSPKELKETKDYQELLATGRNWCILRLHDGKILYESFHHDPQGRGYYYNRRYLSYIDVLVHVLNYSKRLECAHKLGYERKEGLYSKFGIIVEPKE